MEITIQVRAPELCEALKELADSLRQRPAAPALQFTRPPPQAEAAPVQPVTPAPAETPATTPTPRKRRTKAEMEADAAAEAAAQPTAPAAEVKEAAPEQQAPLPATPVAATTTSAPAPSTAPTASTAYPTPVDLASLKAIAVSHATDIEKGTEHVKFCLGKFNAATLSLLNPALYGQFATALWGMRKSEKG